MISKYSKIPHLWSRTLKRFDLLSFLIVCQCKRMKLAIFQLQSLICIEIRLRICVLLALISFKVWRQENQDCLTTSFESGILILSAFFLQDQFLECTFKNLNCFCCYSLNVIQNQISFLSKSNFYFRCFLFQFQYQVYMIGINAFI